MQLQVAASSAASLTLHLQAPDVCIVLSQVRNHPYSHFLNTEILCSPHELRHAANVRFSNSEIATGEVPSHKTLSYESADTTAIQLTWNGVERCILGKMVLTRCPCAESYSSPSSSHTGRLMPSIGDVQADLASLWSLASSLAQWQADLTAATARALGIALPLTETSAVVLELECRLRCNLKRFTQVSVAAATAVPLGA